MIQNDSTTRKKLKKKKKKKNNHPQIDKEKLMQRRSRDVSLIVSFEIHNPEIGEKDFNLINEVGAGGVLC